MARVDARARLGISLGVGIVAFVPALLLTQWQVAALVGWDATAATFVLLIFAATRGRDSLATRELATTEDDSRTVADAILIGASIFSLVGVVFALGAAGSAQGGGKTGITAVGLLSVLLSWASVHAVYMLTYARLYYTENGGIDFHTDVPPDYGDFLYVSLTLGMTFQVSDTDLNSKAIRMTAMRHALLSYMFGAVVVATTINVVATLLTK